MVRICSLFGVFLLLGESLAAQSLGKQADRQFGQMAYAQAVNLYEQALTNSASLSESDRRAAKVKLGYSYYQMHDTQNAERVYRELMNEGALGPEYTQCYLYYAQSLASNGKYRESQAMYEKYTKAQPDDKRGQAFSKLYRDVTPLTSNADSYSWNF